MALNPGKSKKAFFLTFISILVVSLFVMTFATNINVRTPETSKSSWARVDTLDRYVADVRTLYLDRAVTASSNAAFDAMVLHAQNQRRPLNDVEYNFTELVLYGTLSGTPQPRMRNMTLRNWSDRMQNLSTDAFGFDTNISTGSIILQQISPWQVNVQVDFTVTVNKSEVRYRFARTSDINISIIGKLDPLHALNGFNRTIIPTNITNWSVQDNTYFQLRTQRYRTNTFQMAPSYLMRFANDTRGSACCGIESLLNGSYGIFNRSYVDYKFWNGTDDVCIASALNLSTFAVLPGTNTAEGLNRFRLDSQDMMLYNATQDFRFC
jgi:hypothetical protein